MLNVELLAGGMDDVMRTVLNDLESVLGKKVSKARKDEMIYKTLGVINALWYMLQITETDKDVESTSDVTGEI